MAVSLICAAVNFFRKRYYLCYNKSNKMGKVKEAYMIQEEIIQHVEEQLGEGKAQGFDILEHCYKQEITPAQARETFLAADKSNLEKLLNGEI